MSAPAVPRAGHRHLPALDGLRGLALLGVLVFHSNGALRGGYLGVDLFFVLSGFLITSLLLNEHAQTGRIALAAFWGRRARRLFPALLVLMPAIALYALLLAKPVELAGIRADALATLGYVANWRTIFAGKSYWELFANPSPLEHTWSLAIEEQFYVLWPLVVALALRRYSRRLVLGLALTLTVMSMVAMVILFERSGASRAYLGTDTRASGILAGAALATLIRPDAAFSGRTVRVLDGVGLAAALGLAVAWLQLDGQDPFLYRGGFWLAELAALALIACAVSGARSLVARALSVRPLILVGKVSYGAYLYHWPLNLVLTPERVHVDGLWLDAVRLVATFALAAASYRWLEQPIRTGGAPFGRPVVVLPVAIAAAVLLVLGAAMPRPALAGPAWMPPRNPSTKPFRVMVLGDSTANSLGWVLRGVRDPAVSVELKGEDGCSMLRDSCEGASWAGYKSSSHPDATLVILGGAFLYGGNFDDGWREACHPAWDTRFESALTQRLAEVAPNEGQVWAATVPYPLGRYDKPSYRAIVDCINGSVRKVAAAVPGVRVLELAELLCPGGRCEREPGMLMRPDGVHYDLEASRPFGRRLLEVLRRN